MAAGKAAATEAEVLLLALLLIATKQSDEQLEAWVVAVELEKERAAEVERLYP